MLTFYLFDFSQIFDKKLCRYVDHLKKIKCLEISWRLNRQIMSKALVMTVEKFYFI